jgi:hypothetical protein
MSGHQFYKLYLRWNEQLSANFIETLTILSVDEIGRRLNENNRPTDVGATVTAALQIKRECCAFAYFDSNVRLGGIVYCNCYPDKIHTKISCAVKTQ